MTGSFPWIRPLLWRQGLLGYFWILLIIGCWAAAQDNPRITEHPTDHYVSEGNPTKLTCSAEGDPEPVVAWYRNGQKVDTGQGIMKHRLAIKSNDRYELFFLRIIHEKNNTPDVGNYYCNATNIHGSAISHTASIKLAVLEDVFQKSPSSLEKAVGETAEFQCIPPHGAPSPTVHWSHNGQPLMADTDPRISTNSRGDLVISPVESDDAGEYTCVAMNKGGEKESSPAILTVLEKPYFVDMPDELKVSVGATVEFKCRAAGDPKPSVQWRMEEGRIAFGRARQLDDGTLRIEKVQIADGGVYVCVAQNIAGTVEAVGKLLVETQPSFLISPKDVTVALGRTAVLQCVATGNPKPTVFWNVGDDKKLVFPHQPFGRFRMSPDGTLRIHEVTFSDQGTYMCKALNVLGKSNRTATVTVLPDDDRLPPVIEAGPRNQTIAPGKVAMLTCQVRSPKAGPAPQVTWYRNGRLLLVNTDTRMTELNSGTLQISDVRLRDSGWYKCKAVSETGETEWDAFLTVSKQGSNHRSQSLTGPPEAPTKLRVSDIADTSVRLTWTPSDRNDETDVEGYIVEFFSPHTSGGWQTASDTVSLDGYTVKNLEPDTKYVFAVRARNSQGVGPPSDVTGYITTRERRRNLNVNLPEEEIARELKKLRIELNPGKATNATHIRVTWEIRDSLSAIEGYIVNYTYLIALDPMTYGSTEVMRVADPYKLRANFGGLRPASWYQVCVKAYARRQESPWSNSVNILTPESIPSRPPTNIVIQKEDNAFHVQWSPPDPAYQNGVITGYDIDCMSEVDQSNCSTSVKGRATSVVISKVTVDGSYRVRVAARTRQGRGVWSNEIIMGPEKTTLIQEAWFVWVLVGTIGGTLWLALCVFSVWLFRRRRRNNKKKMAQNGMYSAVPVHKSEESGRPGGGIGRDDVIYSQKEGNIHTAYGGLQSDLASLLDCGHKEGPHLGETPAGGQLYSAASVSGPHSKTYYQRPPGGPCPPPPPSSSSVAPYATTTLINKGVNPQPRPGQSLEAPGAGFRPINHAYVHSSASGSGDSCNKPDMRSSDSNTDNSRPTTGHYSYAAGCCPHDHCEGLASPSSDSGSITTDENGIQVKRPHKYSRIGGPTGCLSCPNCAGGKQGQQAHMNLAELLPPPPEHPPPHHEMMMVGQSVGPGSRHGGGGNDMGSCTLNRHNPHAYLYGNDTGGSNMAETRFIESRCSPASACSCPQVPHDRMRGNINNNTVSNNTVSNNTMPYSDMEYPVHSHGSHAHSLHNTPHQPYPRYHEGSHQDGGGGGGPGNSYGCERPYSPKLLNTGRGEAGAGSSSGGSNRCQSPLSCLNCGSSYPPQQQQPPPPAPPSSSSSSNNSQQHHHPQQQQQQPFNPNAPHYHYHNNPHMSQGGGVYPQVGGAYNHQPVALHGYRIPPMEAEYKSHEGEDGGVSMDRACQSSLPSLANDCLQAGYGRRPDSPPSEDHHDYVGESDMEVQQRVDCPTPDSSVNGEGGSASDADFASAVARAAQLSGLTVVGTTVTDPKSSGNSKKYRKHRTPPARPHSPYSTDSNMSAVVHKPYPKSDRKKQLLEQARKYGQRKDGVGQNMDIEEADAPGVNT